MVITSMEKMVGGLISTVVDCWACNGGLSSRKKSFCNWVLTLIIGYKLGKF